MYIKKCQKRNEDIRIIRDREQENSIERKEHKNCQHQMYTFVAMMSRE